MPASTRGAARSGGPGLTLLVACMLLAAAPAAAQAGAEARALYPQIAQKLAADDGKGALALAEQAVTAAPGDAEAYLWLGRACGQRALESSVVNKLGWARKCKAAWDQAVKLDPRNADVRASLVQYHLQAPGVAGGDEKQARANADALLGIDPVRGNIAWAQIHAHDRDTTAATASLQRAAAAEPVDSTVAKVALANWYLQGGRTSDARAVWDDRLARRPGDLYARYQLGRISAIRGGDLDAAVGHLTAYLAGDPRPGWPPRASAQWRLGQVYEKLGRRPEALAAYDASLRLDPKQAQAKKDLDRLRKAR